MSKNKHINSVCAAITAVVLMITLLVMIAAPNITAQSEPEYVKRLFSTDIVHNLDIMVNEKDWNEMLENALDKKYIPVDVVINGERIENAGIRTKGASSLIAVDQSKSNRFSFKIEFDHYEKGKTYHGLDKLALNNMIQDNTYLMDYLAYDMMRYVGAEAPYSSFVWITVNGRDWGLYTAVEGIEEAFAQRNYGSDFGNIYKPETDNFLFGEEDKVSNGTLSEKLYTDLEKGEQTDIIIAEGEQIEESSALGNDIVIAIDESMGESAEGLQDNLDGVDLIIPEGEQEDKNSTSGSDIVMEIDDNADEMIPEDFDRKIGNADVSLIYTDDNPDNYSNIFNHSALGNITMTDKQRLIKSIKQLNARENLQDVLNVNEVIRYFVAHNFVLNGDSYTGSLVHNYYLREHKGKLSMIPWDYNLSFGGIPMDFANAGNRATSYVNAPIDSPVTRGDTESRPMVSWIFSSDDYREAYHKVFSNFIAEYFESGHFENSFQETVEMIAPYIQRDPTAFCTYNEFLKGTQTLKNFCLLRAKSIRKQLEGEIPSTIEGQEKNLNTLIDGSHIDLSAMTKEGDIGDIIN